MRLSRLGMAIRRSVLDGFYGLIVAGSASSRSNAPGARAGPIVHIALALVVLIQLVLWYCDCFWATLDVRPLAAFIVLRSASPPRCCSITKYYAGRALSISYSARSKPPPIGLS